MFKWQKIVEPEEGGLNVIPFGESNDTLRDSGGLRPQGPPSICPDATLILFNLLIMYHYFFLATWTVDKIIPAQGDSVPSDVAIFYEDYDPLMS